MRLLSIIFLCAFSHQVLAVDYDDCTYRAEKLYKEAKNMNYSHGERLEDIRQSIANVENALNRAKKACESDNRSFCLFIAGIAYNQGLSSAENICKGATAWHPNDDCMLCARAGAKK